MEMRSLELQMSITFKHERNACEIYMYKVLLAFLLVLCCFYFLLHLFLVASFSNSF